MLTTRISNSIEDRLNRIARRTGRTKSAIAREAIISHLPVFEKLAKRRHPRAAKRARTVDAAPPRKARIR